MRAHDMGVHFSCDYVFYDGAYYFQNDYYSFSHPWHKNVDMHGTVNARR